MAENKNMELYETFCTPPHDALKAIDFGPLKGKSDINPQWRYEVMTAKLGACGVGWKFTIDSHWTQEVPQTSEMMLFVMVTLYIKQGKEWSEGIPAYGGDYLIKKDKNGIHGNDEAMKMAITDALGTAMKYIGVAGDVYRGLLNGVNVGADTKYSKYAETSQNAPQKEKNPPAEAPNDKVRAQAIKRLNEIIKKYGLNKGYLQNFAFGKIGKRSTEEMTDKEIIMLAEALEAYHG